MAVTSHSLRIKILKFGYSAGLTSIYWDDSACLMKFSPSKYRHGWIVVQMLLVFPYELFLIYQSTLRNFGSGFSENKLIRIRYMTAVWML